MADGFTPVPPSTPPGMPEGPLRPRPRLAVRWPYAVAALVLLASCVLASIALPSMLTSAAMKQLPAAPVIEPPTNPSQQYPGYVSLPPGSGSEGAVMLLTRAALGQNVYVSTSEPESLVPRGPAFNQGDNKWRQDFTYVPAGDRAVVRLIVTEAESSEGDAGPIGLGDDILLLRSSGLQYSTDNTGWTIALRALPGSEGEDQVASIFDTLRKRREGAAVTRIAGTGNHEQQNPLVATKRISVACEYDSGEPRQESVDLVLSGNRWVLDP